MFLIFRRLPASVHFIHFFCKNKLYKNNETGNSQKIRTSLEHLETGKCKDKKNNKNDELYFFKQITKEWLNPTKVI